MSGSELLIELKQRNCDSPMIVLTADVESGSKAKYLKRGFDEYLKKQINLNIIMNYTNISIDEIFKILERLNMINL